LVVRLMATKVCAVVRSAAGKRRGEVGLEWAVLALAAVLSSNSAPTSGAAAAASLTVVLGTADPTLRKKND
jgi:hypothetical protein